MKQYDNLVQEVLVCVIILEQSLVQEGGFRILSRKLPYYPQRSGSQDYPQQP